MQQEQNRSVNFFYTYWKLCLLVLVLLVIMVLGLFWLAGSLTILIASYRLLCYCCLRIKGALLRNVAHNALIIIYIFIFSIGAKLFLVDLYKIPSISMENTLFTNDVILVNKLIYGPKMPDHFSDISWIAFFTSKQTSKSKPAERNKSFYTRATGIARIKQGDVLVYQLTPIYFVVKRCVAVAGDTLIIRDGEIYTNTKNYPSPETVKNKYQLIFKDKDNFFRFLDSLTEKDKVYSHNPSLKYIIGNFTSKELTKFRRIPQISIRRVIDSFSQERKIFANPPDAHWTYDNMGPFLIPQKGMKIKLTPENWAIYKRIIQRFEKAQLEARQDKYYINGTMTTTYTFKQNYYFAMGDNRKEALDSRYTGFIPEENVIGKSPYILFSTYKDSFRWDRIMKRIL